MTSPDEAVAAREAGADVLVVQGAEAGGHRGSWTTPTARTCRVLELLAALHEAVDLPLVAAGGIAAADGCRTRSPQAPSPRRSAPRSCSRRKRERAMRIAARSRTAATTGVTRAFSGRRARAIVNEFMRAHPTAPSAYPQVLIMTAPLRESDDPRAAQPLGRRELRARRGAPRSARSCARLAP